MGVVRVYYFAALEKKRGGQDSMYMQLCSSLRGSSNGSYLRNVLAGESHKASIQDKTAPEVYLNSL